jgi:hypothetical protein
LEVVRRFATPLLLAYVLGVLALTLPPDFSPDPTDYLGETAWTPLRLEPFEVDAPSFLLNVVMFVPFGVLLPLRLPWAGTFWRMLACAVAASLSIEIAQLIINLTLDGRRTVDINDLVANAVGALLGLGLLRLARPGQPSR